MKITNLSINKNKGQSMLKRACFRIAIHQDLDAKIESKHDNYVNSHEDIE